MGTPLGIQLNSMVDPAVGTRVLAGLILGFVGYKLVPMITDLIGNNSNEEDEGKHDAMVASLPSSTSATAVSSPLTATALASELEVVAGVNELENDDSVAIASALVAEVSAPTPW